MGVEFNEHEPLGYNYQPKKAGLGSLLIKLGLAKNEAGAICHANVKYYSIMVSLKGIPNYGWCLDSAKLASKLSSGLTLIAPWGVCQ
jgi:hypothetical protein